jgi:hypothetical protein
MKNFELIKDNYLEHIKGKSDPEEKRKVKNIIII